MQTTNELFHHKFMVKATTVKLHEINVILMSTKHIFRTRHPRGQKINHGNLAPTLFDLRTELHTLG